MKKSKSFFIFSILLLNLFDFSLMASPESNFYGISLVKSFKDIKNHNPCITQKFTADPGLLEYNGSIYVYGTNDGTLQTNAPK